MRPYTNLEPGIPMVSFAPTGPTRSSEPTRKIEHIHRLALSLKSVMNTSFSNACG